MKFEMQFPDSAFQDDPKGYAKFFKALQAMLDRMAMSHFKYQHRTVPPTMEAAVKPIDEIQSAMTRIAMYDALWVDLRILNECKKEMNTGNTENLLDAANMLVIEHCYPKHPKAHFKAQGSHESPGLEYIP